MTNKVDAVTLGVVNLLGLGGLGIDRMVCGCWVSGFLKLFLLVLAIVMIFFAPLVGAILFVFYGIWVFVDYVAVMIALLSSRLNVPLFCDMRIIPSTKYVGRILGFVALGLFVVSSLVPLIAV